MTHFYLRLVSTLTLLFVISGSVMVALGSTQPINPALRGFVEGCEGIPQPCWFGITPNNLNVDYELVLEANYDIRAVYQFYSSLDNILCDVTFYDSVQFEDHIALSNCADVDIGDVMAIMGEPEALHYDDGQFSFVFANNTVYASTEGDELSEINLNQYMNIELIVMYSPAGYIDYLWHGFTPLWFYCRLEDRWSICDR